MNPQQNAAQYRIEPLADKHNRVAFSCGVEAPDRYLQRQAGQDIGKHVAAAFVITPDGKTVASFCALSAHTRSRIRAISTKKTAESTS